jgi:uncharacterized LabA/DUF88 family protein
MATVIVYVDGVNLYYGAVKGTPYKWLDIAAVCERLFPGDEIVRIRYFTARIKGREGDPGAPQRQETYLRALRTVPRLSIHEGHFREDIRRRRLAHPPRGGPATVDVLITEEKGSDVNLATYLIHDALTGACETSIVISNDSDLTLPIDLLSQQGHPVGVVNPHPPVRASSDLRRVAAFYKQLRQGTLATCQFSETLVDDQGALNRPSAWGLPAS